MIILGYIFPHISIKVHGLDAHLKCLIEVLWMSTHNICLRRTGEIFPEQILP